MAISGILTGGFTMGALAVLLKRDGRQPEIDSSTLAPAALDEMADRAPHHFAVRSCDGYRIADQSGGQLLAEALAITLPAYTGPMLAASLMRIASPVTPAWNNT
jgi:hypothetical protein